MKAKFEIGDLVKTIDGRTGKVFDRRTVRFNPWNTRKMYTIKGSHKRYYSFELKKA